MDDSGCRFFPLALRSSYSFVCPLIVRGTLYMPCFHVETELSGYFLVVIILSLLCYYYFLLTAPEWFRSIASSSGRNIRVRYYMFNSAASPRVQASRPYGDVSLPGSLINDDVKSDLECIGQGLQTMR